MKKKNIQYRNQIQGYRYLYFTKLKKKLKKNIV